MPLENPYPKDKRTHCILCRVDPQDYFFLKGRFYLSGFTDKITATLYKKFVDEIRRLHSIRPIEGGIDDPQPILADVLSRLTFVERCPVGEPVGRETSSPQNAERGVDGVRETVCTSEKQRPDAKEITKGKRRNKPKTKEGEKV